MIKEWLGSYKPANEQEAKDPNRIEIWSPKYFHDLVSHLKIKKDQI